MLVEEQNECDVNMLAGPLQGIFSVVVSNMGAGEYL